MSTKRKFTEAEIESVKKLWYEGLSDKEIGEKIGRHWRSVQNIRKKFGLTQESRNAIRDASHTTPFEKMTRDERIYYLRNKFETSARFKMMMRTLTEDELKVFEEEYFRIAEETDDLTQTEEQSLFLAIYELVLALKSQTSRADEERLVHETRQGLHQQGDPGYRTHVDSRYDKEYNAHMNSFQKFYEALKFNREQRLKDEMKTKQSFLDYAMTYAQRSSQEVAAAEILELSQKKDEELKRLIKNGWLKSNYVVKEKDSAKKVS